VRPRASNDILSTFAYRTFNIFAQHAWPWLAREHVACLSTEPNSGPLQSW